jgi:hypothetical protein
MAEPVSRERQMARLAIFAGMKAGIETAIEKCRYSDLTTGQFAAQIFLEIGKHQVAFYLDDDGGFARPRQYSAEDRERWRAEVAEAKRTMSREGFDDWLYRRVNSVGER